MTQSQTSLKSKAASNNKTISLSQVQAAFKQANKRHVLNKNCLSIQEKSELSPHTGILLESIIHEHIRNSIRLSRGTEKSSETAQSYSKRKKCNELGILLVYGVFVKMTVINFKMYYYFTCFKSNIVASALIFTSFSGIIEENFFSLV